MQAPPLLHLCTVIGTSFLSFVSSHIQSRSKEGVDEEGVDEEGVDEEGVDEEGVDEEGVDEEGVDEEGPGVGPGPNCPDFSSSKSP